MSAYLALRKIRIVLWGAFFIALIIATFKPSDPMLANVTRYAPPLFLALALATGLAERLVRHRNGIPARRFGGA